MFGGGFSGRAPLTRSLVDMAGGSAIAGREATPTGTDDWSFTVQELIDFTGALPIRAQHHALGFPVAEADPVRAAANSSAAPASWDKKCGGDERDGEDDGDNEVEDDEWPSSPISVLHVRFVHIESGSALAR